ncbi:MAG: hypothetical protein Q9188_001287 [Gyalolechia gomerana]
MAHVVFSTLKKPVFTWIDTFEDVETADLEALIVECRTALQILQVELDARPNPQVDTDPELKDCYESIREKADNIKHMGLSKMDEVYLERAGDCLSMLRSGHVDSSLTRETRPHGHVYQQLLWLVFKVAGPAYALLLICCVRKRKVERLNSIQIPKLAIHVARHRDLLSTHVLDEKAKEVGLYANAISLIQRVSGKRKRGQSGNTTPSVAYTYGDQAVSPIQGSAAIIVPPCQFQDVDPASRALATILSFLGQSKIPLRLLKRARGPFLTWDKNGEVTTENVDIVEVVQDESMCERAIYDLRQLEAVRVEESTEQSTDENRWVSANPQVLPRMIHDEDHLRWKIEAVKVVLYAFPLDRRLEPAYYFSIAISLLPLLKHVLQYLGEIEKALPAAHVVEVCLSASYYSTLEWKAHIVGIANSIVTRFSLDDQLHNRVELREKILSRSSSWEWDPEVQRLEFHRIDQRSNGYYGESVLFNAEVLLGREEFEAAIEELDGYTAWDCQNISTLEQIVICEMSFLRGKIHHFSGKFKEARIHLEQVVHAQPTETSIICKAMSHLTTVCCELGKPELGINYAWTQLDDLTTNKSRESGSAKRLRLALAYAYLMHGMWAIFAQSSGSGYKSLPKDIREGFDRAHELFRVLAQCSENVRSLSRAGKINRFSALLGLALIAHIKSDYDGARDCYDEALTAASRCTWNTGYIEAIIYWSKSTVMFRLGEMKEMQELTKLAGKLYRQRSFFFPGLGTLWPEIIGSWVARQGDKRVIPGHIWETTI